MTAEVSQEFEWPSQGHEVSYEDIRQIISNPREIVLIDVRGREEFNMGNIPNSVNLPLDELNDSMSITNDEFLKKFGFIRPQIDTKIVLTCRTGRRSGIAYGHLLDFGYKSVLNYPGSWNEYSERISGKL
ncbi:hypothetical protein K7432_015000 [Basidiobolus ranarum]|uniref:Sulfurtransferase n=1 Tax=Basidiobolus ranarum TaxID=34480 RepID=A0ABR2VPK1_9FUNG